MPRIRKDIVKEYAAAAYSFEQLGTDYVPAGYTGKCINVRRSIDDTNQDIGFSGGWLDETALISFVTNGGASPTANGFIEIWYDQSGNSNNITLLTHASQPQIVSSGSVMKVNSRPSANFAGSQYLYGAIPQIINYCISVFLTANYTDRSTTRTAVSLGTVSNVNYLGVGWQGAGYYNFYHSYPDGLAVESPIAGTNDLKLFTARTVYEYAELSLRSNSIEGSNSVESCLAFREVVMTNNFSLGRTHYWGSNLVGNISECIVFKKGLFSNQTIQLENLIKSKFGL